MKPFLIMIFLLFPCFQSHALEASDSLKIELEKATGKKKADILNALADLSLETDKNKANQYAQEALRLSQKNNYINGQACALSANGYYLYLSGDHTAAIEKQREALNLVGDDPNLRITGICYIRLANIYESLEKTSDSMRLLHKALPIFIKTNDPVNTSYVENFIGYLLWVNGEYDNALEYFIQALKIRETLGNRADLAKTENNMGSVYFQKGDYENALVYFLRSLKIIDDVSRKKGVAYTLGNIGKTYVNLGKSLEAMDYFHQAVAAGERAKDKPALGYAYNGIGSVYEIQGKYDLSLVYYKKSLSYYQMEKDIGGEILNINSIGKLYNQIGDYSLALKYSKKAFDEAAQLKNPGNQAIALTIMGIAYSHLDKPQEALESIQQSLTILKKPASAILSRKTIHNYLKFMPRWDVIGMRSIISGCTPP